MPHSPRHKLGPYELLARLGAGGVGELCKANGTRLDPTVAVKTSETEFSERFEREAIAALNYCQIWQIDVGPDYLVAETIRFQAERLPC